MRRTKRIVLLIALAFAAPVLSGCANFDPDNLDIFGLNEKKKLPGERRAVFPEGVPGVSQGIPPEYLKGNQPPPETAVVIPPEPEKPVVKRAAAVKPQKPKRKPRPAAVQQQPAAQQQAPSPWPEPQGQSAGTAPWPNAPPPSGTFSR